MEQKLPCEANWWLAENQDNAMTGLHDYMMYRKYGYGRGAAQISVDVRSGLVSRERALTWVRNHDGIFPEIYAGVPIHAVRERIGVTRAELNKIIDKFTNWNLFRRVVDDENAVPILVE